LKVQTILGQALVPTFPEEMEISVGSSERLFVARKQLMIERAELYEKLKFWTHEDTLCRIYEMFRIPMSSRKKKEKVLGMLCK